MKRENIELDFNDRYKIIIDPQNWMPVRKGVNKDKESKNFGKPTEFAIGYCHNLGFAIRCILQDMVRRGEEAREITRAEDMIDWYFGEQQKIYEQISVLREELQEALETNKVL